MSDTQWGAVVGRWDDPEKRRTGSGQVVRLRERPRQAGGRGQAGKLEEGEQVRALRGCWLLLRGDRRILVELRNGILVGIRE